MASTSAGLLDATYTPPAGAVRIAAGTNIQSVVDKYPPGTAFVLGAGTHSGQTINVRSGDQFYGENGATILDGNGLTKAFAGQGDSNVTIAGLKITDYAPPTQGIGVLGTDSGSTNWKVLGNEFYGIKAGTVIMLGNGMVVRDNYIHDNNWTGIGGWNVKDAVIENNEIARNNLSGQSPFTVTGDGAGIKVVQATGTQIRNNYVHDNVAGPGIWTDINCDLSVIEGNLVQDNAAGGIFIELDYGATVRNNTVSGNNNPQYGGFGGGGIYVFNAQDLDIYANTFSGNGGGVWVYEENRGTGNQGAWITQDVNVYGNIIAAASGRNGIGGTATNDSTIRFYDNDYALTGSATLVYGSNVSVSQWQSYGFDTSASGSTFGTTVPTSPTPTPTPTPTPEPTPTAPSPATIGIGSGPDTLVLKMSQDAWNGSAQYTVKVDGVQQGGTLTASAWHSSGQSDTVTIKGDWAPGAHTVTVTFLNDAWGGTAGGDRNLYVDAMGYNGAWISGASADLFLNGASNLVFNDTATAPSSPTPVSLSTGSGPDTLVLKISQDAWQGSAQYTVAVDGVQKGGTFTASALRSSGQSDTLTIKGDWATGVHTVTITFLNDAYGGTGTTDRNLYVDAMSYNGATVSGASAKLLSNGPASLSFTDGTVLVGQKITGGSGADMLTGTAGNDTITGRVGNDTMTGGSGEDRFIINAKNGFDIIKDFAAGEDEILFNNIAASSVKTAVKTFNGVTGLDIAYGSDATHHVFLEKVTALQAGDLIFA